MQHQVTIFVIVILLLAVYFNKMNEEHMANIIYSTGNDLVNICKQCNKQCKYSHPSKGVYKCIPIK